MPFGGALTAGILGGSSLLGGLFGGKKKTTTTDNRYSNTYSNTTTPNVPANQQALYDQLLAIVGGRLSGNTPLQGYEATGLQNINSTSDAIRNSIQNRLVASGTYGSPNANTALNNLDVSRGAQAAQFRNSIPLLQDSLQMQNLGAAGTIFGLGPKGTTSTGTSSGTGQAINTGPSNMFGGGFGGLAEALAYMMGLGVKKP